VDAQPPPRTSRDPAEQLYLEVATEISKKQNAAAERDVTAMLKKFKDSPYTSNALYLFAENLYESSNYVKSAEEFERLYKTYPDGNKAVGALYKLALCYQKLGHPSEAQETFENIVALYPGSREALDSEKQILNTTSDGETGKSQ
jgi:tol-pal system protein YbgF